MTERALTSMQGKGQDFCLQEKQEADKATALGANVIILDDEQPMDEMQKRIDDVYQKQMNNEFGEERLAILFRPGYYHLDVKVGYYTTVHGLGIKPNDVVIEGAVRSKAALPDGNATINFWRGVENLTIIPKVQEDKNMLVWATSQATWLRRVHVIGRLALSDGGWSSGGYIADSRVEGRVDNGTQQQYFIRNTSMRKFNGGSYAQVFVGCQGAPSEDWPKEPYSTIQKTPRIREKPWLALDGRGEYVLQIPPTRRERDGTSWEGKGQHRKHRSVPLSSLYVAHADKDTDDTLNTQLREGRSIFFTPGIYEVKAPLHVIKANTVLLGIGLATIRTTNGTQAIIVDDLDGVHLAGLLLEATEKSAPSLCRIGDSTKSSKRHLSNPVVLSDVLFRVGGAVGGKTKKMLVVNLRDTILDHIWLWRADHGDGVGWDENTCSNGLVVHGDHVIAYALFAEHSQGHQIVWDGEHGRVYFYQSEFPYDVPNGQVWSDSGKKGFSSYKVGDNVKRHFATGLGIYCVFVASDNIRAHTAIEQPRSRGWMSRKRVLIRHASTVRFGGNKGTGIDHVINKKGQAVEETNRVAKLKSLYARE